MLWESSEAATSTRASQTSTRQLLYTNVPAPGRIVGVGGIGVVVAVGAVDVALVVVVVVVGAVDVVLAVVVVVVLVVDEDVRQPLAPQLPAGHCPQVVVSMLHEASKKSQHCDPGHTQFPWLGTLASVCTLSTKILARHNEGKEKEWKAGS